MTEWSEAVAYRCRHCKEHTINERGSLAADEGACQACALVPTLEEPAAAGADRR